MKLVLLISIVFISSIIAQQVHKFNSYPPSGISRWTSNTYFRNHINNDLLDTSAAISKVGQWGNGPCYSAAVKGNYAYIGNGLTLQVLDISNPAKPKVIGELLTNTLIRKVVVSGNYVYTISPFQIFDVSNPAKPVLVSSYQLPAGYPPTAFIVKDNYAFVGDFHGLIFIIDISDPSNPQELGNIGAAGEMVQAIVIKDTVLYATTYDSPGINVFNISNPYSPYRIGLVGAGSTPGTSLAINKHYLYFGSSSLLVFDINNPSNPRYISGIHVSSAIRSISVIDSIAYIIQDTVGLAQLDVSDTNKIHIVSKIYNPYSFPYDDPGGGFVEGTISYPYAYIASGTGLWTVNIEKPDSISSISFFPTGWFINKIAVDSSDHAFLAELHGGLKILDFSVPSSPKLIGYNSPGEQVIDVAVANNFAYLLCDSDLQVLDITELSSPKLLGKVPFNDTITSTIEGNYDFLCLNGNTVYAARKSQKLYAIDVENPNDPKLKSTYSLREIPVGISISDNFLYVADFDTGIQIFNASDPHSPNEEGFLPVTPLRGLAIEKNNLLVEGWEGTELGKAALVTYDAINPLNPVMKSLLNIPGGITTFVDIKTENNFAYLTCNSTFIVVNIANPDSGRIVYSENAINFNWSFNSVAVSNSIALAGYLGINVYKNNLVTGIKTTSLPRVNFTLFQNYPNPFNPNTIISYWLPVTSNITLRVYNVLGQKVFEKNLGIKNAGTYKMNVNMNYFASGIYFYAITAISINGERFISAKKMELLK